VRGQRAIEPGAQRTPARGLVGKRKRRQPLARPAAERPERAREDRLDLGRGELLVVEDVRHPGEHHVPRPVAPRRRRRALDELRQLKAGEGAGDAHPGQQLRRRPAALLGESHQAIRVETISRVEEKHRFPPQERCRQKVVGQARALRVAADHHQRRPVRQDPEQAPGRAGEGGSGRGLGSRQAGHNGTSRGIIGE